MSTRLADQPCCNTPPARRQASRSTSPGGMSTARQPASVAGCHAPPAGRHRSSGSRPRAAPRPGSRSSQGATRTAPAPAGRGTPRRTPMASHRAKGPAFPAEPPAAGPGRPARRCGPPAISPTGARPRRPASHASSALQEAARPVLLGRQRAPHPAAQVLPAAPAACRLSNRGLQQRAVAARPCRASCSSTSPRLLPVEPGAALAAPGDPPPGYQIRTSSAAGQEHLAPGVRDAQAPNGLPRVTCSSVSRPDHVRGAERGAPRDGPAAVPVRASASSTVRPCSRASCSAALQAEHADAVGDEVGRRPRLHHPLAQHAAGEPGEGPGITARLAVPGRAASSSSRR
jgi:hypothetical protein